MGKVYHLRDEFRKGLNYTPSSQSNGNLPSSPGFCWEEQWVGCTNPGSEPGDVASAGTGRDRARGSGLLGTCALNAQLLSEGRVRLSSKQDSRELVVEKLSGHIFLLPKRD